MVTYIFDSFTKNPHISTSHSFIDYDGKNAIIDGNNGYLKINEGDATYLHIDGNMSIDDTISMSIDIKGNNNSEFYISWGDQVRYIKPNPHWDIYNLIIDTQGYRDFFIGCYKKVYVDNVEVTVQPAVPEVSSLLLSLIAIICYHRIRFR